MRFEEKIAILTKSGLVHKNWYLEHYPDVAMLGMEPVNHYLKYGAMMGRNPGKTFDTKYYVETYSDVRESGMNPLLHYVLHGKDEGKLPRQNTLRTPKVKDLKLQMWGGLGDYAARKLRDIVEDTNSPEAMRFEASSALAAWQDFVGDTDGAIALLEQLGNMQPDLASSPERVIPLAFLYLKTGAVQSAEAALATIPNDKRDANGILVAANLLNSAQKLSIINDIFATNDLAKLRLRDSNEPLSLANLETEPAECQLPDIGKVSIIMPAYSAEAFIETAIRSVCNQTYRNIELIVVDDCSPDNTFQIVQSLAEQDPRIIPIRQEQNAGAYPARNRGLREATGEFLTTHDADDWSHTQKIEKQLATLQQKDSIVGVICHWARVRPDLTFTSNWRLSEKVIHWSHSSFLFRRKVFERLGPWDAVRVSADTEYIWRVETAFGKNNIKRILPEVPLAFALDDDNSLTRSKLSHVSTTYYGLRHYYREICRYWHNRSPDGLAPEDEVKKFSMIPREMFVRDENPLKVDLLLQGNCGNVAVVKKMDALLKEKRPLLAGVAHVLSPNSPVGTSYAVKFVDAFFDLIGNENVRIVLPNKDVIAAEIIDLN